MKMGIFQNYIENWERRVGFHVVGERPLSTVNQNWKFHSEKFGKTKTSFAIDQ